MGTFRKIVLTIVLVFSIFMLNIDRRYLFGWTEEEEDELEELANEYDIPYNEYSDADDYYADNGYDDYDDYWDTMGYDDADDFWETQDEVKDAAFENWVTNYIGVSVENLGEYWYDNGDGTYDVDINNDGKIDKIVFMNDYGEWISFDQEYINRVDFKDASDRLIIETILNGIANQHCILSELFNNIPPVSYVSNKVGTDIFLDGIKFTVIINIFIYEDVDYSDFGLITRSEFENIYGCWQPINIPNNATLRILVSCNDDVGKFLDLLYK